MEGAAKFLQKFPLAAFNPKTEVAWGSAPAPGAVFRALAENIVPTQ
jgi:hypothetical protein